jgi:hypothetical protein
MTTFLKRRRNTLGSEAVGGREPAPFRSSKPIKSGTGGAVRSSSGADVTSRGYATPEIKVRAEFAPGALDRVDREMKDESMARQLDMPVENYRRATSPPKAADDGGDTLFLAKGGLVRDCNDHMNTSRGVDRLPASVKHSKR